jgi:hypothetical protein
MKLRRVFSLIPHCFQWVAGMESRFISMKVIIKRWRIGMEACSQTTEGRGAR